MEYINDNLEIKEKTHFTRGGTSEQAMVTDANQNLVAIGQIIWENEMIFFKPSKVFI